SPSLIRRKLAKAHQTPVFLLNGNPACFSRPFYPDADAVYVTYEKEIEAFGTVFTIVSMQKIGTSAVQSRATGGVAGGTYLFALPGSPGACKDAWDEILAFQLDYRHRPCNFVEIFPRLDEHQRRK
ncbi:MAG: molybdopterin-binding protein, partial [Pseudomonadota bacterium]|nr:molybdopterin-binding protein [Pseudomonadota bacterium]